MNEVSPWRLNVLRAAYLLLVVGAGWLNWSQILDPSRSWEMMEGFVVCMLGAISALALLGLRQPLRMLPLLFWEMAWKIIWLLRVALPAWLADEVDEHLAANIVACSLVLLIIIAVPWRHAIRRYLLAPAEAWR